MTAKLAADIARCKGVGSDDPEEGWRTGCDICARRLFGTSYENSDLQMKKTLSTAALILLFSSQLHAASHLKALKDDTPGKDATNHIMAGGIVSGLTAHYLPEHWSPLAKGGLGLLASVLVGAGSEALDKNFDGKDLAQWGIGGVSGVLVVNVRF